MPAEKLEKKVSLFASYGYEIEKIYIFAHWMRVLRPMGDNNYQFFELRVNTANSK